MSVEPRLETLTSKDSEDRIDYEDDSDYDESDCTRLMNRKYVSSADAHHQDSEVKLINETQHKSRHLRLYIFKWALEPYFFMVMFFRETAMSSLTYMTMEKACSNSLNFSAQICNNLSYHKEEKVKVEQIGNEFAQYNLLIHISVSAIAMIFIGPWSDKYSRKLPLILSTLGACMQDVGLILNTYYFKWPLTYLLIMSFPLGITGGPICIITIIYSMVSEMTTGEARTFRCALLQFSFALGMALGCLTGGYLYDRYSYLTVFIVSAIGHAISFIWAVIVIQETKSFSESSSLKQKIAYLFSFKNLTAGFKACTKVRPNKGRLQIWFLIISMCPILLIYISIASIKYIYTYHMYGWGPLQYAEVYSVFTCMEVTASSIFLIVAIRILKLEDPILGFIGVVSLGASNICIAFASNPHLYYIGCTIGLLSNIGSSSIKSLFSKIVEEDELGKFFSFLSICESFVPILGTIAMTYIFNATLSHFPGLIYLIAGILLLFPAAVFIWLARLTPTNLILDVTEISADRIA